MRYAWRRNEFNALAHRSDLFKLPLAVQTDTNSPKGDSEQATTDPASATATDGQQADGQTTLPAVEDTCAGACKENDRLQVQHPKYGPLEIVLYTDVTSGSAAPSTGTVSYAVYQNETSVGVASGEDGAGVLGFTPSSPNFEISYDFAANTDKYGNVYFYTYGSGVSVLTPTDEGYASNGILPGKDNPFDRSTKLTVDESGEPTIWVPTLDDEGRETGETYTFDGQQFMKAS